MRVEGAWEAWLRFFLQGVVEVADSTTDTTRSISKTYVYGEYMDILNEGTEV